MSQRVDDEVQSLEHCEVAEIRRARKEYTLSRHPERISSRII